MISRLTRDFRGFLPGVAVLMTLAAITLWGCSSSKPRPVPSARDGFDAAMRLYDNGKWEDARTTFEAVVFNHPGSAIVDSAQYMMAMCYFRQKDPILAAAEFERLHTHYPTSDLVDDADYMRAVCLIASAPSHTGLDQEKTRDAVNELKLFKDNHPLSEYIPKVDSLLSESYRVLSQKDFDTGRLYMKLNHPESARIYFQGLIDAYPESPLVPEALYYMAEGQRKLDSLDNAVQYYEKIIYLYPDNERAEKARKRVARIAREREEDTQAADTATDGN